MWNFGYHLARGRGAFIRSIYRRLSPLRIRQEITNEIQLDLDVFTYSGEAALAEQVASARSFLKHAGRPKSFTIVSDGSYSPQSIATLRQIDPILRVCHARDFVPANVPAALRDYLTQHATGKQLALILSLPRQRPAFYFDSDVRFFAGASCLDELLRSRPTAPALYLADCQFAGDERLLHRVEEKANPVNTGVLLLFRPIDWSVALERLCKLDATPSFFTNQTITHLAMHAAGAQPFDPGKFVLQLDDQFLFGDRYAGPHLALRHYVNPVRHKFWSSFPE